MKISHFYPLLFLVLLCTQFTAVAQQESKRQINFKLTDPAIQTSHTYHLNNVTYIVSNAFPAQDESKQLREGSCSISLDLGQDMDPFLLKWIAGEMKNATGVITMVSADGSKKTRNIAFTGGRPAGSSESFYGSEVNSAVQISFYVNTLSIDGTSIFKSTGN
ncbi:hypothetical protein TH53_19390 [Pedobacter lusitanus]|uniref:Contig89, whole genome shotgun sequence n=1 Tax=Pedobacter lusitanus TaxID=1503925 RepID=A0A0D0GMF4_9SPHI|nr:hypothetical protein [Pedobacter lusitanus]KIO75651.1 hypothetical protein TH53_19390 [Pedobacter lusitanus]